jgi:fermentation-respiration switch protein FrsA (DUF1100 family)
LIFVYIVGIAVCIYAGWGLVLLFMQPKLTFGAIRTISYTPQDWDIDYEDVYFDTSDKIQLNGWYIPAEGSEITVLFCHANAGNISHRLETIKIFNELGVNCFIFDYRGYGKSQGKPNEQGTYKDAEAAYNWLCQVKGVSPEQIVVFGRSLGGSIAAYLASKADVSGLVIESAFTSFADMGQKLYPYLPVRPFVFYKYNTLEYLRTVKCPVMFFYSRDDSFVPFKFGQKLYESANEPKKFIEISGGHNEAFLVSKDIYQQTWTNWLGSIFKKDVKQLRQLAS